MSGGLVDAPGDVVVRVLWELLRDGVCVVCIVGALMLWAMGAQYAATLSRGRALAYLGTITLLAGAVVGLAVYVALEQW